MPRRKKLTPQELITRQMQDGVDVDAELGKADRLPKYLSAEQLVDRRIEQYRGPLGFLKR